MSHQHHSSFPSPQFTKQSRLKVNSLALVLWAVSHDLPQLMRFAVDRQFRHDGANPPADQDQVLSSRGEKRHLFLPEFSRRRIVPAGPCGPVQSGSGAAGISAGVRGGEGTPSAIHHHLRGQRHQGLTPTGQRHGNKYKRGTWQQREGLTFISGVQIHSGSGSLLQALCVFILCLAPFKCPTCMRSWSQLALIIFFTYKADRKPKYKKNDTSANKNVRILSENPSKFYSRTNQGWIKYIISLDTNTAKKILSFLSQFIFDLKSKCVGDTALKPHICTFNWFSQLVSTWCINECMFGENQYGSNTGWSLVCPTASSRMYTQENEFLSVRLQDLVREAVDRMWAWKQDSAVIHVSLSRCSLRWSTSAGGSRSSPWSVHSTRTPTSTSACRTSRAGRSAVMCWEVWRCSPRPRWSSARRSTCISPERWTSGRDSLNSWLNRTHTVKITEKCDR